VVAAYRRGQRPELGLLVGRPVRPRSGHVADRRALRVVLEHELDCAMRVVE
jgi:hypothetical protein